MQTTCTLTNGEIFQCYFILSWPPIKICTLPIKIKSYSLTLALFQISTVSKNKIDRTKQLLRVVVVLKNLEWWCLSHSRKMVSFPKPFIIFPHLQDIMDKLRNVKYYLCEENYLLIINPEAKTRQTLLYF